MHPIDTSGSINGRFSEGNPAIGQRATRVGADWLNDVQANLLAVLTEGAVAPTKGRADDLLDAVKAIVRNAGGGSGADAGAVPNTRRITGGGLLHDQGGDLTADRVFTLARASAVEIAAGAEDGKVVTPKGLYDAMTGSLADHSATIGPLTIKTGRAEGVFHEGSYYTAFPQAFAVECWTVIPVARNDPGIDNRDVWPQLVGRPAKDGFTVFLQRGGGTGINNQLDGFEWIAIGR